MRSYIVAGNWKMNLGPTEGGTLARDLLADPRIASAGGSNTVVVICPPFVTVPAVHAIVAGSALALGAQNCHAESHGAYTGEISASMLKDAGCAWVILGHSERRRDYRETDTQIGHKVTATLAAGLRPIVCVGESHQQRLDGVTTQVITEQIRGIVETIGTDALGHVVIAYEPIWAIGTGLAATPEQAQDVHAAIRQVVSADTSVHVPILYGGSVTDQNAAELFACADIDGALVGGASLKVGTFAGIVQAATQAGRA